MKYYWLLLIAAPIAFALRLAWKSYLADLRAAIDDHDSGMKSPRS